MMILMGMLMGTVTVMGTGSVMETVRGTRTEQERNGNGYGTVENGNGTETVR